MKKKILIIISCIIIALFVGFGIYVPDYYHADETALAVLKEQGVTTEDNLTILTPENQSDTAIIFYAGAKVEPEAYLPILDKLRDKGFMCVLVHMPFNLAVLDANEAENVIEKFEQIEHWYIAGHSMGGAMASNFASKNKDKIDGLILLGAYIYGDYSDEDTLTVYGSLNSSVEENIDYTKNIVVIEGGGHAEFGNYGEQDGYQKATISADEQQNQTVNAIYEFINSRK